MDIYTNRGKGRYLKPKYYEIELVIFGKEGFSEKMKAKGYELKTKNIIFEKIKYDEMIFNKLGVTKEEEVITVTSQMTFANLAQTQDADFIFILSDTSPEKIKGVFRDAKVGDLYAY